MSSSKIFKVLLVSTVTNTTRERIRIFNQQIEGTVSIIKGEARVKEELTALGKYDFHGGVMNI